MFKGYNTKISLSQFVYNNPGWSWCSMFTLLLFQGPRVGDRGNVLQCQHRPPVQGQAPGQTGGDAGAHQVRKLYMCWFMVYFIDPLKIYLWWCFIEKFQIEKRDPSLSWSMFKISCTFHVNCLLFPGENCCFMVRLISRLVSSSIPQIVLYKWDLGPHSYSFLRE